MRTLLTAAVLAVATSSWGWRVRFGGFNRNSATADARGDVLSVSRVGVQPLVLKTSGTSGRTLWRRELVPFPDPREIDHAQAIATDRAGDAFLAMAYGAGGGARALRIFGVTKVDGPTGHVLWRSRVPNAIGSFGVVDGANTVAVDESGDVLAAGGILPDDEDSDHFLPDPLDFAVVKLSGATGEEMWRYVIPSAPFVVASPLFVGEFATALTLDAAGDAIVVGRGRVDNSERNSTVIVAKLAGATGAELWRRELRHAGGDLIADDVVLDRNGDVVLAGEQTTRLEERFTFAGFVVKLAGASGADLWRVEAAETSGFTAATVDAAGDVIAAARLVGTIGDPGPGVAVWKLAGGSGAELWRWVIPSSMIGDELRSLTLSASGDVLAAGRTGGAFAVIRLADATGEPLATHTMDNQGFTATASAVKEDARGHVVATGLARSERANWFIIAGWSDRLRGSRLRASDGRTHLLSVSSIDDRVLAPASGSVGDPTVHGAVLEVGNANAGEAVAIPLPAERWRAEPGPIPGRQRFRYLDPAGAAGPCRAVIVESAERLQVRCQGPSLDLPLGERDGRTIDVTLRLGDIGPRYCLSFGGTVLRNGASTFEAAGAPPPRTCPVASR